MQPLIAGMDDVTHRSTVYENGRPDAPEVIGMLPGMSGGNINGK